MRRAMSALAGLCGGALVALALGSSVQAAAFTQPAPGDWRPADAENTLVIDTNQGRIIVELIPSVAPLSVERLKVLTRQHFYDGLTFFRVIDDFMDQTGDPKNTGEGGSTLPQVPGEFVFSRAPADPIAIYDKAPGQEIGFLGVLPVSSQPIAMAPLMASGKVAASGMFCPGVIGMARAQDPDSANSQFFIMRQNHDALNKRYAAIGRVLAGEDVARRIKTGEPVPAPQDRMTKVQILADMPADSRPKVQVLDTRSAYFANLVAQSKAARGTDFNICDIDIAAEVK
ncbi:MAG: peptidylprolyl isomerase [Caulobacteraceae bacterium]|nr:peptidylprolyl isomerase [Caulobacteraceae bacterium]